MRIRVESVGPVVKEKNYFHFPLEFKNEQGKTLTRKIVSFEEKPYNVLKEANEGDEFDVKVVKEGEYYKWKEVAPATGEAGGSRQAKSTNGYAARDQLEREKFEYDTTVRQFAIIRQSCLSNAVALRPGVQVDEVLEIAEIMENWVNR